MKKKFLSLMMAAAVVASTSVSAFAATSNGVTTDEVTIGAGETEKEVEIGIEGNILNDDGNKVPGTINVTVPTATTFSVNATNGTLTSPKMTITNNGEQKIKVIASSFEDSNGDEDIKIITRSEFEQNEQDSNPNERGIIWLRLKGATNNLGLTSKNKGTMYDNDYLNEKTAESGYELGKINENGGKMVLELEGKGGTETTDSKPSNTAIQDNFKLVLKIARAQ